MDRETLENLKRAIVEGDIEGAPRIVESLLRSGIDPDRILDALIEAMEIVGEKFEKGEYYIPETLLSSHAMKAAFEILKPRLRIERARERGRIVIGTIEGDIHDIGKNIVASLLEGAGFEVIDLGRDVPCEEFIERALELGADVIAISALMSTTRERMRDVIEIAKRRGIRDRIVILVGGGSVTDDFARMIGADGYAEDARKAVKLVRSILRARRVVEA